MVYSIPNILKCTFSTQFEVIYCLSLDMRVMSTTLIISIVADDELSIFPVDWCGAGPGTSGQWALAAAQLTCPV